MNTSAKLIFFCGKMAAGKSTLARNLAVRENTIRLVQDDFLNALFPGEITDIPGFVKCSSRLQSALTPHICALLTKGITVVLDFPGNTKVQREWLRELVERANVEHVGCVYALCKSQLRERSAGLTAGTPWTRDADFEAVTAYFQPPSENENFNVVRHERDQYALADPIARRGGRPASQTQDPG
jgi:predicted kinase